MPTATQIASTEMIINGARCQALFSSALQPSDAPTADMVADAINRTVQRLGLGGCVARMAQEFGDHPTQPSSRCAGRASSPLVRPPGRRQHDSTAAAAQANSPNTITCTSDGRLEMNETCDRCGPAVRAVYRVDRDGELYLCGHCTNQLRPVLSAQGWSVRLIGEHTLAPHAA